MAPKVQNQEPKKKAVPPPPEEPMVTAAPEDTAEQPAAGATEETVPFDELYVTHKALEMLGVLLESSNIKSMNGTLQVM